LDKNAYSRNIKAHEGLDHLGFPHKMINFIVLEEIRKWFKNFSFIEASKFRVLDIGCGTGYLLKKLLSHGWDVLGVDPFPRGTAADHPLRQNVFKGTIEEVHGDPFHVITAVEVLEHVDHYMNLLASIVKLLHPQGIIIVTVPNDWEFHSIKADDDSIVPKYGHVWRFNAGSFEADLKKFSDDVMVEPIYSGSLDRRLLSITRFFPRKIVHKLSQLLIKQKSDAGWLLGVAKAGRDFGDIQEGRIHAPSAINFFVDKTRKEGAIHTKPSQEVSR
jgi:SAM-dependent methyltransferase